MSDSCKLLLCTAAAAAAAAAAEVRSGVPLQTAREGVLKATRLASRRRKKHCVFCMSGVSLGGVEFDVGCEYIAAQRHVGVVSDAEVVVLGEKMRAGEFERLQQLFIVSLLFTFYFSCFFLSVCLGTLTLG